MLLAIRIHWFNPLKKRALKTMLKLSGKRCQASLCLSRANSKSVSRRRRKRAAAQQASAEKGAVLSSSSARGGGAAAWPLPPVYGLNQRFGHSLNFGHNHAVSRLLSDLAV